MELVLNEEQRMIRDGATSFFRERGGVGRLRALHEGKAAPGASDAVWKDIAGLGWLGMTVPERWGGVGLGMAEMCLVAEAAGRVLAPEPIVGCAVLPVDAIALGGDDATRGAWLPKLVSGGARAAVAWDEAGMRGDVRKTATEARAVGSDGGGHALHGAKIDVLGVSDAAGLDVLIVHARDGLYLVDPRAAGVTITAQRRIDSLPCARVKLDGAPAIGRLDASVFARVLDRATVAQSAELLGNASAAFEITLAYLRDRQQFGVAIGTFQALRHRAARLYIGLELARSAVMTAARLIDTPGADAILVAQTVSLAKARTSDSALQVGDEAVQMHGGIGMTEEHDIGLYYKRLRVAAMTLGDGAFHRDRWAALGGY